jgi:hypothetical protein
MFALIGCAAFIGCDPASRARVASTVDSAGVRIVSTPLTVVICCGPGVIRLTASGTVIGHSQAILKSFVGALPDGGSIEIHHQHSNLLDAPERLVRLDTLADSLFHIPPSGGLGHLIGAFRDREEVTLADPGENPFGYNQMPIETPFVREPHYAIGGGGYVHAPGDVLRADMFDHTGRWRASFRLERPPVTVSDAMWEHFRTTSLARFKRRDRVAFMAWILERVPRPATLPLLGGLLVADDGDIWMRERVVSTDSTQLWHVISAAGGYRGVVRLPIGWTLQQVGADFIIAATENAAGDPIVVRHALIPHGPGR